MIKRAIQYFFKKPWRPILALGITLSLFIVSNTYRTPITHNLAAIILFSSFLVLVTSTIFQLIKKKWMGAVLSFLSIIFALSILALIALTNYTHRLSIFNEAQTKYYEEFALFDAKTTRSLNDAINENNIYEMNDSTKVRFELLHTSEYGFYSYTVGLNKEIAGVIYLQLLDPQTNENISSEELRTNTTIEVNSKEGTITQYTSTNSFTFFAASPTAQKIGKIELWYQTEDEKPLKLDEEYYTLHGWQEK